MESNSTRTFPIPPRAQKSGLTYKSTEHPAAQLALSSVQDLKKNQEAGEEEKKRTNRPGTSNNLMNNLGWKGQTTNEQCFPKRIPSKQHFLKYKSLYKY